MILRSISLHFHLSLAVAVWILYNALMILMIRVWYNYRPSIHLFSHVSIRRCSGVVFNPSCN